MLDEYISWRDHLSTTESKIEKNIYLLYQARQVLTETSLKTIVSSYIHSYLNYANIAWTSANVTKLNRIHLQSQSVNEEFRSNENFTLSHTRSLLRKVNVLNIFQIIMYHHLTFIDKFKNIQAPNIFYDIIRKSQHKHQTKFS